MNDGDKNFYNRGAFKIGLRHWTGTLIIAIAAGFVIFGLLHGQEFLASFLVGRETKKIQRELERPYREDKYGGKTPEETFDLFLEALRKGDIELASKYFELENQGGWLISLQEVKQNNQINEFIKELEDNRRNWKLVKNNGREAVYEYIFVVETPFVEEFPVKGGTQKLVHPAGEFKGDIFFEKNPYSEVWKLINI